MKTVGIAIDDYKLATFKRVLEGAGYTFNKHPGLSKGTLFLKVETDDVSKLQPVVEKANRECKS